MNQYSTFRLGDRLFGLDIMMIREINRILDITPVPHARDHIRGLINLRGQIVTILDLGVRLGLPRLDIGEESHNVILKTNAELATARQAGSSKNFSTSTDLVGFLVDAIGDVVEADDSSIEPPSANVSEAESQFLSGVIKTDTGLLVLLDIREVLHGE
jgi:purine-binding chemotaxis protein CheW